MDIKVDLPCPQFEAPVQGFAEKYFPDGTFLSTDWDTMLAGVCTFVDSAFWLENIGCHMLLMAWSGEWTGGVVDGEDRLLPHDFELQEVYYLQWAGRLHWRLSRSHSHLLEWSGGTRYCNSDSNTRLASQLTASYISPKESKQMMNCCLGWKLALQRMAPVAEFHLSSVITLHSDVLKQPNLTSFEESFNTLLYV